MGKSVCEEAFKLSKEEVFDKSMTYWNSGKTKEWLDLKIDLLIGKREGYYFWDMDGKKLMDVHINGGTYSLGHRNPEVIEALKACGNGDQSVTGRYEACDLWLKWRRDRGFRFEMCKGGDQTEKDRVHSECVSWAYRTCGSGRK